MAGKGGRGDLLQVVRGNPSPSGHFKFPTPTARDHKDTGDLSNVPENGLLPRVVQRMEREAWPTPKATHAGRDPGQSTRWGPGNSQRSNVKDALRYRQATAGEPTTGSLNPTWVEWLMGFPLGWTDCER
jgi:hypothetical protein